MELRFQMNDILPLLPVPRPPMGRSSYNIPCPICNHAGSRKRHLNINLKRNEVRCPKCGQFEGGVFDLYAYYTDVLRGKVREDLIDRLDGKGSRYAGKAAGPKSACSKPKEIPQAAVASIEIRDHVYRVLLSKLTLASEHRENLLGRGLTGEGIDRLGRIQSIHIRLDKKIKKAGNFSLFPAWISWTVRVPKTGVTWPVPFGSVST